MLWRTLSVLVLVAATAVPALADDLIFHDLAPCRLIDTRDGSGASTSDDTPGALANPGPHFFRVQGFCGIPVPALAAELNFSVVSPSQTGDLRAFPADGPTPVVATMSYEGGILALSNSVIMPLGAVADPSDDDLQVLIGMAVAGAIHLVIDVTGYFDELVEGVEIGDITSVTGGTGLSETPAGGAAGDVTIDLEVPYRLPQLCADGQIAVWDDTNDEWDCGDDNAGGGGGVAASYAARHNQLSTSAGTTHYGPAGASNPADVQTTLPAAQRIEILSPETGCTAQNLRVRQVHQTTGAPVVLGADATRTFTLLIEGSPSTLTCTINATESSCLSAATATLAAGGQRLAIQDDNGPDGSYPAADALIVWECVSP